MKKCAAAQGSVGREHLDQQPHDAGRRVELMNAPAFTLWAAFGSLSRSARLPAVLSLRAGELGEEVLIRCAHPSGSTACCLSRFARLIDAAKDVLAAALLVAEADGADEIDEFAEAVLVQRGAGVVLGQDAFQARVVPLDGDHGVVHDLADGGLLGAVLQVAPPRSGRHPEDVLRFVFVRVLGIRPGVVAFAFHELRMVLLEAVGDVFEEDEAEDDVLVLLSAPALPLRAALSGRLSRSARLRRVHVVPQLIGGEPQFGLEAKIGSGILGSSLGFRRSRHGQMRISRQGTKSPPFKMRHRL